MSDIHHILSEYERENFLERVMAHVDELVPRLVERKIDEALRRLIDNAEEDFARRLGELVLQHASRLR